MAKLLIIIGTILVVAGVILHWHSRLPIPGRLPGDIVIERGDVKIYIPVMSSILLSLLVTLVIYLVNKFKG
ncbi:MAG: DUF2905 domain-containing protein [Bacteroidia bacterium]|nr:DUF2905 domain-containing protein [Bacteroidia bacterium]